MEPQLTSDEKNRLHKIVSELRQPIWSKVDLEPVDSRAAALFRQDLIELAELADFSNRLTFKSRRKIFGFLITFLVHLTFKIFRPVIRVLFRNQIRFNHLSANAACRIAALEDTVAELSARVNSLAARNLDG